MGNFSCKSRQTRVTPEEQLACLEMKVVRMNMKLINYNEFVWAWKPSEDSQSFTDGALPGTTQDKQDQESNNVKIHYWND